MSRNNNHYPQQALVSDLAEDLGDVKQEDRQGSFAIMALYPKLIDAKGLSRRIGALVGFAEQEFRWPDLRLEIVRALYENTQKLDIYKQETNFHSVSRRIVAPKMIDPVKEVLTGNTTLGTIMDVRSHLGLRSMPLGHHTYFPEKSGLPDMGERGLDELEESVLWAARIRGSEPLDPDDDGHEELKLWYPTVARSLGHFSTAAFALTAHVERLPDNSVVARRDVGLFLPSDETAQAAENLLHGLDSRKPISRMVLGQIENLLKEDIGSSDEDSLSIEMKTNFTIINPDQAKSSADHRYWDVRNRVFS